MIIQVKKDINAKALAWQIRKATGINCGGYTETGVVAQTGSISSSEAHGVFVEIPDGTDNSKVIAIATILDGHDEKAAMPADVPPDPPVVPRKTLKEQYAEAPDKQDFIAQYLGMK